MSKDKVSSPRETEPKKKTLRGTIRPCTLLLHIKVSDQGHSAVKTAPSPPLTPPCYKNRTQQNTTVQAEPGTKSGSNKNKTETRDTTSLHSSIKIATAHRKAVKARQKGDRGPAVFGGSETAAASGWLHPLGSAAGTGRGGCEGAMLDLLSLSEVQGTGCMCSWLGKMPQTPFFQREGGTQGEGRGPQSLPRPPHAQQGSQSRDHPSPGRVHGPQEPARLHSQGCIHMA